MIRKYRRITPISEAAQFRVNEPWPKGVKVINDMPYCEPKVGLGDLDDGDWIIYDDDGSVLIRVDSEYFTKHHELVDES